jgi:DNA-binding NarL/FixJ family response regulator
LTLFSTCSDPAGILSIREVEVAGLVGRGATNTEIARALYMSEGTARNHVSKILQKLGFRDRTRLAVHTAECGWTGRRASKIFSPKRRR